MADKFELSESDINQVLTIFTDIDRESVCRDLQITKSPIATINRILDGNFLIDEYQTHQEINLLPDLNDAELFDVFPSLKNDKNLPCCSTDMDKSMESSKLDCKKNNFGSKEIEYCNRKQKYKTVHEISSSDESDLDNKKKSIAFPQKQIFSTLSNDVLNEEDSDKEYYRPLRERIKAHASSVYELPSIENRNNDSEKVPTTLLSESDSDESSNRNTSNVKHLMTKNGMKLSCPRVSKKTTLIKRDNASLSESNESDDEMIKNQNIHSNTLNQKNLVLTSSEDDDMELPDIDSNCMSQESSSIITSQNSVSSASCDPKFEAENCSKKVLKRKTAKEIEESKKLSLISKEQRQKEHEAKKLQKEKTAFLKKAYTESKKAILPGECLKYIKVILDTAVVEGLWGTYILTSLQKTEINYIVEPQPVKLSISWSRKIALPEKQDGDEVRLEVKEVIENEVVLLIGIGDFVNLVFIFKVRQQDGDNMGESLRSYGQRMLDIFPGKKITFIVQGVEKYFRDLKTLQQRQFRAAVSNGDESTRIRKQRKVADIDIVISRIDVEEALIDLQLHTNINVHLVETLEEVGSLVAAISKAIAETPYKRDKYKSQFSFLSDGSCTKSLKVDKDGKGLLKVWQSQIQQFHLVSPDIAGAIVAAYPSPQLLLEAYKKCATTKEAKNLLKDIIIRRGSGVLATTRKVGPELSRKMYTLFTSKDGSLLINEK